MFAAYSQVSSDSRPDEPVADAAAAEARDWLQQSSFQVHQPPRAASPNPRISRSSSSSARSASPGRGQRSGSSRGRRSRSRDRGCSRRHRSRSERRRAPRSRTSRKERRPSRSRPPTKEELVAQFSTSQNFLDDVGLQPEHAFRQDWAGDRRLLKERAMPPSMAVHAKIRLKWPLGDTRSGPRSSRRVQPRFFHKSYVKHFLAEAEDLSAGLQIRGEFHCPRFIGLAVTPAAVEPEAEDRIRSIYDPATQAYAEGRAWTASEMGTETIKLHQVQERTREFNQKLRDNPHDIPLWLAFVEFQNVSYEDSEFGDESTGSTQPQKKKKKSTKNVILKQRALIEKQLAILKAATDQNPKSIELAVKRLDLSKEILETPVLDRQWQELIFVFPKNLDLWKHYIRFVSTHFASFSMSKSLRAFKTCFQKLRTLQTRSFTTLDPQDRPDDLEAYMLDFLNHLCHFLARSGYREKAVGLFQAMIELNLFSPDFPGYYSLEDRLALFEPFWESGVPRFGEPGVVGWRTVMQNKSNVENIESHAQSSELEDEILAQAANRVAKPRLWLELEAIREKRHWCPWRSSEEEAEDPDRVVSFEDIAPYLFQFTEPHLCFKLILAFLNFLGLEFKDQPLQLTRINSQTVRGFLRASAHEVQSVDVDWTDDFACPIVKSVSPHWREDASFETFARNVFSQGSKILSEPYKSQVIFLWLDFEAQVFNHKVRGKFLGDKSKRKALTKELKQLVRSLLQHDQTNIDVYIAYARLEEQTDGYASAWKILEMALLSQSQEPHCGLYQAAVAESMAQLKASHAPEIRTRTLGLLINACQSQVYSPNDPSSNPIDILQRAEEGLILVQSDIQSRIREQTVISELDARNFVQNPAIDCVPEVFHRIYFAVILLFLTQGWEEAWNYLKFIQTHLGGPESGAKSRLLLENVLKLSLDLARFHCEEDKRFYQVARIILRECLEHFPSSPYFLQGLCDLNISPNAIDLTWRRFTNTMIGHNEKSSLPQIFGIKLLLKNYALSRNVDEFAASASTAYLHRSKSMLEHQIAHESGRTCPVLWRLLLWITQEIQTSQKNHHLDAVNTVFYRALQECTVTRAIYLDFIEYTKVAPGQDEELQKILHILTEKEGRVRMPWEELEILLMKEDDQEEED